MSAEWVTAIATVGTFLVIAATAGAAVLQLRHLRSSNQIVALNQIKSTLESEMYRSAIRFVREELPDRYKNAEVRCILLETLRSKELEPLTLIANFFEEIGTFVRAGYIDKIACDIWGALILDCWTKLEPFITNHRIAADHPMDWINFEYLAMLSERARDESTKRGGDYPRAARRMPRSAAWAETLERIASREEK